MKIKMKIGLEERFRKYYENYSKAKQGNREQSEIQTLALQSLGLLALIAKRDQSTAEEVMHELIGMFLTPNETREEYHKLLMDSGIAER
jgi:hypothetical protein